MAEEGGEVVEEVEGRGQRRPVGGEMGGTMGWQRRGRASAWDS